MPKHDLDSALGSAFSGMNPNRNKPQTANTDTGLTSAFDHMKNANKSPADNLIKKNATPSSDEWYNFLQVSIADKVYGGSMGEEDSGNWRKNLDLKKSLLKGGHSKEYFADKIGTTASNTEIDTVSYGNVGNFEFNVIDKTTGASRKVSEMSGGTNTNKNVTGLGWQLDDAMEGDWKERKENMEGVNVFDPKAEKYEGFMSFLKTNLEETGVEAQMKEFPNISKHYDKYKSEFGTE